MDNDNIGTLDDGDSIHIRKINGKYYANSFRCDGQKSLKSGSADKIISFVRRRIKNNVDLADSDKEMGLIDKVRYLLSRWVKG